MSQSFGTIPFRDSFLFYLRFILYFLFLLISICQEPPPPFKTFRPLPRRLEKWSVFLHAFLPVLTKQD